MCDAVQINTHVMHFQLTMDHMLGNVYWHCFLVLLWNVQSGKSEKQQGLKLKDINLVLICSDNNLLHMTIPCKQNETIILYGGKEK
jgi:hypothetical protein